jgi:hypothetical protein
LVLGVAGTLGGLGLERRLIATSPVPLPSSVHRRHAALDGLGNALKVPDR